jgi:hypothetical protein
MASGTWSRVLKWIIQNLALVRTHGALAERHGLRETDLF